MGVYLVRFNKKNQGILRCKHNKKDDCIKLLKHIKEINNNEVSVETVGTSGTIKSLIKKHIPDF